MSDILFLCPACSKHLAVDEAAKGRTVKCVGCGQPVSVPIDVSATDCPACAWQLALPPGLAGEMFRCPNCGEPVVMPLPVGAPPSPPASTPPGSHCPRCGTPVAQHAVVCLICGVDLRTGKPKLTLKKDAAAAKEAKPPQRQPYRPPRPEKSDGRREAEVALANERNWSSLRARTERSSSESDEISLKTVYWFFGVCGAIMVLLFGGLYAYSSYEEDKQKAEAAKIEQAKADERRAEQQRWDSMSEEQKQAERERQQIEAGYKVLGDGDARHGRAVADKIIEDENDRRMRQARGILDVHIVP